MFGYELQWLSYELQRYIRTALGHQSSSTSHKGLAMTRTQGLGYEPQRVRLCATRVWLRTYEAQAFAYEPQGFGYEPQGFYYEPQGFGYEPPGFGYEPQGFGYQAQGFGYVCSTKVRL